MFHADKKENAVSQLLLGKRHHEPVISPPKSWRCLNARVQVDCWFPFCDVRIVSDGIGHASGQADATAYANNQVVVGTGAGSLYALNAASGGVNWSVATGGVYVKAPIVANGVIYASSQNDLLFAFNEATGAMLASGAPGASFIGGPAVSDGVLYLNTLGSNTYAFALGSGTQVVRAPKPASLRPDLSLKVSR